MTHVTARAGRWLLAALIPLGGCYSYVRTPIEGAPVGLEYRVLVTRGQLEALRDVDSGGLPESGPPLIRGTLVAREGGELAFRVPIAARRVGFHQAGIGRQIRLPLGAVVELEQRRLDRAKTGFAVAGLGALAGGVVLAILNGSRFWDFNPDAPLPDALRPYPTPDR